MDLLLTEFLTCPHCGPDFGLVLLADRVEGRRILEGELGCPNCRDRYPVRRGFADLRPAPRPSLPTGIPVEPVSAEEALRIAALLGLAGGPGYVLLAGPTGRAARSVLRLAGEVELITLDPALADWQEEPGISRMTTGATLPFRGSPLRAAALAGADLTLLEEASRLLVHGGRLLLERAAPDASAELESLGYEILAKDAETLVAGRP